MVGANSPLLTIFSTTDYSNRGIDITCDTSTNKSCDGTTYKCGAYGDFPEDCLMMASGGGPYSWDCVGLCSTAVITRSFVAINCLL